MKNSGLTSRIAMASWILTTCVLLAASQVQASSLRCDGKLISRDDLRAELRAACGEPDMIVPVSHMGVPGVELLPYEALWYYNEGPQRFIREVRLRDARVVRIASRGHGFDPDLPGSCGYMDFEVGMTRLELLARCGEPADRNLRVMRHNHDPRRPQFGSTAVMEEEWIYNFGPRRFVRVLTLVDGRVREVDSGGRGYRE